MIDISMHNVETIEFGARFADNSGMRRIVITDDKGERLQITLFGKTEAIETMPKSADFKDYI